MAKITEVTAYFQGMVFPQKFISVHIGKGYTATLSPGDNRETVEAALLAKARRNVEDELEAIMAGASVAVEG